MNTQLNFTIERGDLLAHKLIVHPRMPGKSVAAEAVERFERARRLANYKNPPRPAVLAQAMSYALHSPSTNNTPKEASHEVERN